MSRFDLPKTCPQCGHTDIALGHYSKKTMRRWDLELALGPICGDRCPDGEHMHWSCRACYYQLRPSPKEHHMDDPNARIYGLLGITGSISPCNWTLADARARAVNVIDDVAPLQVIVRDGDTWTIVPDDPKPVTATEVVKFFTWWLSKDGHHPVETLEFAMRVQDDGVFDDCGQILLPLGTYARRLYKLRYPDLEWNQASEPETESALINARIRLDDLGVPYVPDTRFGVCR